MNTNIPRILLVDCELKILELIPRILKNLRVEIITAKTGEEGLDILRNSNEFALTISNNYLGQGINGREFLKLVNEHSPNTVRILMSAGLDEDSLLENQKESAFDSITRKPILFTNFIGQVESSIKEYLENIKS